MSTDHICAICLDPCHNAITTPCAHVFCNECFQKIARPRKCPLCRARVRHFWPATKVRRALATAPAICPKCMTPGTYKEIEEHLLTCSKRLYKCPNRGCISVVQQRKLDQHLETCPFFARQCPYLSIGCKHTQCMDVFVLEEHLEINCRAHLKMFRRQRSRIQHAVVSEVLAHDNTMDLVELTILESHELIRIGQQRCEVVKICDHTFALLGFQPIAGITHVITSSLTDMRNAVQILRLIH